MGYGNLGRGVECALKQNPDMELTAVFTRRDPGSVKILTEGVNVYPAKDAKDLADQVDVLILCGGSATDLPEQTPEYANILTWWTALILTQRSRSTLRLWIRPQERPETQR